MEDEYGGTEEGDEWEHGGIEGKKRRRKCRKQEEK